MIFRWNFIIFVIVLSVFNITEIECSRGEKKSGNKNRPAVVTTLPTPQILDFPQLNIMDVFENASDMFKKMVSKMISHKKLVGLNAGWNM